jgi:hypothetical protein
LEAIPGKRSVDSVQKLLYLEHHTFYGKYCSLRLEGGAVEITTGSRGEIPGGKVL